MISGWRDLLDPVGALERLRRDVAADAAILAIALATVDRERAAATFVGLVFGPAPADESLGAFALAAPLPDGTRLLLLEPATEGRLAAFLAYHGEAAAAFYVAGRPGPRTPGRRLLAPLGSPLGRPAELLARAGRWGPFLLVSERPAGPA